MPVMIHEAGDSAAATSPSPAPAAQAAPAARPAPSEAVRATNLKAATLTLTSGRSVTVRRLSPLERMMAAKAIGSELVTNALYANYALVACSVSAIDGAGVSMPSTNREIEVIIFRLGEEFDELTELMKDAFSGEDSQPFDPATVKN